MKACQSPSVLQVTGTVLLLATKIDWQKEFPHSGSQRNQKSNFLPKVTVVTQPVPVGECSQGAEGTFQSKSPNRVLGRKPAKAGARVAAAEGTRNRQAPHWRFAEAEDWLAGLSVP